ncbi:uncharacterized protein YegL [Oceanisphaera litoralis]|uniref:retention module-containing protein n=1 Tax=Oceanisphaera litoralis TaxID=225144 RepID=UPI00195CFD74|nr:retention module-containing protein [Oceanisphaera litoralis]MBM7454834.1 uncharacterized protein YegL [Oceanisphaera litoralis]
METTRIDSAVKIVSLQGKAFIIGQDGTVEPVNAGQVLLPGTLLLTDSDSRMVYGDAPPADTSPAPVDDVAMADTEVIQAAILAGLDPTQLFGAPAAGNVTPVATPGGASGSGNAGFVVVDRVGDSVSPEAGFDTAFAPESFASQQRVLPEIEDADSIPVLTVVIDPPPSPPGGGNGGDGGDGGDGGGNGGNGDGGGGDNGGGNTFAYVEESALPDGTNSGSDNECATGRFDIDTGNDALAKLEIRLANGDWVDVTGGGLIEGQYGTLEVTLIDGVYQWRYELSGAADHPGIDKTGAEDVLKENFEVRATDDDGDQASAGLTIDVRDDGPIAENDSFSVTESGLDSYNLMLVIDTSGSMQGDKLALAKAALINLINSYEGIAAELRISVIDFGGSVKGTEKDMTPAQAIAYINTLTAGGFTSYAAPLNEAEGILTDQLADNADEIHKVYFISDGEPNRGDAPEGWQGFVDGNDIDVIAVGVGIEGANAVAELDKVGNGGDDTLVIDSAGELDAALQGTVPTPTQLSGNVLSNDVGGTDAGGADGMYGVVSVSIHVSADNIGDYQNLDGVTIEELGDGAYLVTYVVPVSGTVTITTESGSTLTIGRDGQFDYSGPADVDQDTTESFVYTVKDQDGDTSSATLNITVEDNGQTPPSDGSGGNGSGGNDGGDNGNGSHPGCPPISYWIDHISLPHVAASFAGLWGHALAAAGLLVDQGDIDSGINLSWQNAPDDIVWVREDMFDGEDYLGERLTAYIDNKLDKVDNPEFFVLEVKADGSYEFDLQHLDPISSASFLGGKNLEFELTTMDCSGQKVIHPFDINVDSATQHLVGSAFADPLQALAGAKLHILGLEGDDKLMGGDDIDVLAGGHGHDELNGLLGNNILTGGSGIDTFIFTEADPNSVNVITDFTLEDRLDLSALLTDIDTADLSDCLNFKADHGDTLLQVSPEAGHEWQQIRFENADLLELYGAANSTDLINAMLEQQTLVVDS